MRVYPRVCGGTEGSIEKTCCRSGLSPRMRGNQGLSASVDLGPGSIPAYAGEPALQLVADLRRGVYPRVCGGTLTEAMTPVTGTGLSPRMRGNRIAADAPPVRVGSIPAYAGEPWPAAAAAEAAWVYPRVCGGTLSVQARVTSSPGLSPRMRGNLSPADQSGIDWRSIPAYAGEPPERRTRGCGCRVYPRVCGGTRGCWRKRLSQSGLSPRMRGNPEVRNGDR